MRRGILKRAICDLKGRSGRWTSKCDNIRATSIIEKRWGFALASLETSPHTLPDGAVWHTKDAVMMLMYSTMIVPINGSHLLHSAFNCKLPSRHLRQWLRVALLGIPRWRWVMLLVYCRFVGHCTVCAYLVWIDKITLLLFIAVSCKEAVHCLAHVVENSRMNVCLAFRNTTKIIWTCAQYTQSLKRLPSQQHWLYDFHVKSICAAAYHNNRNSGSCTDNVRASQNHIRYTQRYLSDKVDDKTETVKESSPGLLRRFHQTYKEHGKILVCVHLVTSAVWAGVFYCAAVRYMAWQLLCIACTVSKYNQSHSVYPSSPLDNV